MGKITFTKEPNPNNQFDNSRVVVETTEEALSEILEDFACFLRGCGFLIKGQLEIVDDDD